jgi:Beta-ketoacyl synthase, N-terminal domain
VESAERELAPARNIGQKDEAMRKAVPQKKREDDPVAIVGASFRVPWSARPDARQFRPPEAPNANRPAYEEEWEAAAPEGDFGVSGIPYGQATAMRRGHRLAMELSWTALADAAVVPVRIQGGRVGVFLAASPKDRRW